MLVGDWLVVSRKRRKYYEGERTITLRDDIGATLMGRKQPIREVWNITVRGDIREINLGRVERESENGA